MYRFMISTELGSSGLLLVLWLFKDLKEWRVTNNGYEMGSSTQKALPPLDVGDVAAGVVAEMHAFLRA